MHKEIVFTVTPAPGAFPKYVLIALMAATQLTAPVAGAHAAEFDEAVRAPEAPSNAELKKRIRDYFETYARVNAQSTAGMVRDRAAHAKWFDTQWRLQRAIDARKPLGDLSESGLTPKGDGSYSVDLANFPQWSPLERALTRLLDPQLFELYTTELQERGFRDQDVAVMKEYVRKNQPRTTGLAENAPLAESFAARVKQQLARKERIDTAQVMAFAYQSSRNRAEADRAWAAGLLDSLDQQRQRILESYFVEQERTSTMAIGPDDVDGQTKRLIDSIASGEYTRKLELEKAEVRQ